MTGTAQTRRRAERRIAVPSGDEAACPPQERLQ